MCSLHGLELYPHDTGLQTKSAFQDEHLPGEFVSEVVKAGHQSTFQSFKGTIGSSLQLQQMAEAAFGVEKLREERAAALKSLAGMRSRVATLEAEKMEMNAYFEQQTALVDEQEEMTQQLVNERADIELEMACLVGQRQQIASDRANLIIEISKLDSSRATLEVQQMDLDEEKAKFEAMKAAFEQSTQSLIKNASLSQTGLEIERRRIARQSAAMEAQTRDLDLQKQRVAAEQEAVEKQLTQLIAKHDELDTLRDSLSKEHEELKAERAELQALVVEVTAQKASLEAEQEHLNFRWASLDREQSALEKEQNIVKEQLSHISSEWKLVGAEKARLEALETQLGDREAAVVKLEKQAPTFVDHEFLFDNSPLKSARSLPLSNRQGILQRGDSPHEYELWRGALVNDKERTYHPSTSSPASEVDSCDDPQAVTDSAASICEFAVQNIVKERTAQLKAERLKLWSATGDPKQLDRMLKHLQEREARQAHREMQVEAREAALHEQDRHVEAEEVMREWVLSVRETEIFTKEEELQKAYQQQEQKDEELARLRDMVGQLDNALDDALTQCAAREKELRKAARKRRGWAKQPDTSIYTPLRHRGLHVEDLLTTQNIYCTA